MMINNAYRLNFVFLFCITFFFASHSKKIESKIEYSVNHRLARNSLMHMYTYRVDLFELDYVDTEYSAFKELQKKPVNKAVNYLVVPWARLINLQQLDQFPNLHINGGFTICQHIKYHLIIPILKKIGINVLFSPHALKNEICDGVHVFPFPHRAVNGVEPLRKDILYSFIGYNSHAVREKIFAMPVLQNCIIKERLYWHFSPDSLFPKELTKEEQALEAIEYKNVLARSRYSLCPRGTGPGTLRFWESLQAGAIPIVLADNWALPKWVNWNTCIIQVPENDVLKINDIIKKIPLSLEHSMRLNCINVYKWFSGENIARVVHKYYEQYD